MRSSRLHIFTLALFLSIGVLVLIPAYHVLGDDSVGQANHPEHNRNTYSLNVSEDDIFDNKQAVTFEAPSSTNPSVFTLLREDMVYLLKQPDFYIIVGGLSAIPENIEYEPKAIDLKWMNTPTADRFFESGEILGDAVVPFSLALVSYSAGKIFDSPNTISFASDLFRANVIDGLLTSAMKVSINRKRPDGAPYSFPSGHASHAFATAGVIGSHYGPWVGSASRIVAAYIGISRLQENKHYLSDVIGGAILGSYVAHKITHQNRNSQRLGITPVLENNIYGIGMNVMF